MQSERVADTSLDESSVARVSADQANTAEAGDKQNDSESKDKKTSEQLDLQAAKTAGETSTGNRETANPATAVATTADGATPATSDRKLRSAKSKSSDDADKSLLPGAHSAGSTSESQQQLDDIVGKVAAKVQVESAATDPTSGDSPAASRAAATDESSEAASRQANRQRADASAAAGNAVAVANAAAAPSENGPTRGEASSGGPQAVKSATAKAEGPHEAGHRTRANAGASQRSGRTKGADEMPRVDPARFVGRVAKAFQTAQERGGTLQIRLSPPELGAMRHELTVKDGVMTAALEPDTTSARRVLLEHLPTLRDRLAEQNIRVERFDVDVRRDGTGAQADPRAAHDQQQSQQDQSNQRRRPPAPPVLESALKVRPAAAARTGNDGINLVA
jgi:flagellar hook-length control protein FliK